MQNKTQKNTSEEARTIGTIVNTQSNQNIFESIRQVKNDGTEFWSARDLQKSFGYSKWQNFDAVITKLIDLVAIADLSDKMRITRSGKTIGIKQTVNYELDRLACYKLAMLCQTPECELARTYFAIQTRKQEVQEKPEFKLPQTYKQALKALIEAEEIKEAYEFEIESQNARMLKQEQDSNDTKIILLEAKAGQFKTNAKAIKNDIGSEINKYVKALYLEEAEGKFNIAHTIAQEDYTRSTGYYYPGAKTASLDTKKHYLNWLRSEKAKTLEANRGIIIFR